MRYDLLIRDAQIVTASGVAPGCLGVVEGKIVAVEPELSGDSDNIVDAQGLYAFPGVIDTHVHFNDPGRADWEGVATGSAALAAGGGTTFFDMPLNSSPPVLDGVSFDAKVAALEGHSYADFALWGGLTPNNLQQMEALAERGVVGFKAFMSDSGIEDFPRADDWTLQQGMRKAAALGLPVAVHAESQELISKKIAWMRARERSLGPSDWNEARPALSEADAIQRAMLFASVAGCKLHIVHISDRWCVELARAPYHHVDVTCETCPHYFTLTADDVARIGPSAKCAPPIRAAPEGDQLWQAVRDGLIDIIGSDHSPAPALMKQGDFWEAWGGVAGVQSTLPALLTREPALSLEHIARLTALTPASRFAIPGKGQIAVGYDADLALVDLQQPFVLRRDDLLDRHKLSPYVGRTFRGRVHRTILRGAPTILNGRLVGKPSGRLLKPKRGAI